jgi:hypothetical protein
MRPFSEAELAHILTRPGYRVVGESAPTCTRAAAPTDPELPVGVTPTAPRYRSKTEARFAAEVEQRQRLGDIKAWWHEALRLWLVPGLSYTPDFLVQTKGYDCLPFSAEMPLTLNPAMAAMLYRYDVWGLCLYEVKASQGHVHEPRRALDRLKMAASLYPMFAFRLAQWDRKRHDWTDRRL